MENAEKEIQQLGLLEQTIQNTSVQKQQFHLQLLEIESAIKELDSTKEAYKLVANIMIKSDKEVLKNELSEKKEIVELRIASLEKQESKLREKAEALQKSVLSSMEANR